ncbi:succinylglutamate desuccinylase/aspartoacylase family protein [Burkholderia glumae]|uniref:M14 family metallopeptidase n=1 Tax=Burkholderia glumae TaxID=337 RepID=A0AAQ0BSA6_BURGL|nr:succinylglutamate desuccinylase/aspartoacylase family protein [Burkholderia glumae]ACR32446.1 Succinylglutamate desuccinylase/aspartoacylase [Burkholderia glumae BGR1]AJY63072.1 succinylglutamate desuccinylase / Aspartoacylase family protein [Burkholderia glumae LMG 2196 = ATCC 33617]KHJ63631.1 succinylglutamate desuccinylase [Burkholderia glumae]MCM2484360.1 M14 family metallopeptidase [Burkholderia glumae]MCM2494723.1 M14 family metallopeptidase [Burkholderia glumae]
MQTLTHPLISPALGTERHLTSFHYGPRSGKKIYIQSSLHADELPGMLVATLLRRQFATLEAAGKLRDEIVVVPVPNPIGLAQHVFGDHLGRFELGSMQNFNRNFHDLAALVMPRVEGRLTADPARNLLAVREAMREALDEQKPRTELDSQRLALQRLSYDADVVLDLHCDNDAVMHLYTNPDLWQDVEPLARYLGAQASLLALNSVGNPFDEVHSFCWSELRERFGSRFPIPNGAISVTVELRSERDVSYELAQRDAQAIVEFLTLRGSIEGTAAPLPPLAHPATPLAGTEPLVAPVSGVLVFRTPVGVVVEPGQEIADIVDPLTDRVVTLKASVRGVLYARQVVRFATAGMEVARIAGATPFRSGSLLSA